MAETRVDPTVAGLFLIGLVTLFFGLLGVELFSNSLSDDAVMILGVAGKFIGIIGIILVIFAFMAGKVGNAYATALFAFIAVALFGVGIGLVVEPVAATATAPAVYSVAAYPMLFYAVAFFFLIFALVGFLIGAPKMLGILLLVVGLLYLFVGFYLATLDAPYAIVFAFFGFVAFLLSTYMAFALATQKAPVF
jgi:hypothetical protein